MNVNVFAALVKARKVIESITSIEQIEMARNFLDLAYKRAKCYVKYVEYDPFDSIDMLTTEYSVLKHKLNTMEANQCVQNNTLYVPTPDVGVLLHDSDSVHKEMQEVPM